MAGKPRSQWSPSYRRRIERAEAKGLLSRQAARGHRSREHVTRAERARESGKLSSSERQWLARQAARIGAENNSERWEAAVAAFAELSPEERDDMRAQQRRRQQGAAYAAISGPHFGDKLSPMLLSSRSGLR